MGKALYNFWAREEGQDLTEYQPARDSFARVVNHLDVGECDCFKRPIT
jgi:hypothetical protein